MEEMLLHTADTEAATAEIESIGGEVTLLLGDELLIAKVPAEFVSKKRSFAAAMAHISEEASPETLTYVQAYLMAREKERRPPPPVQSWDEKTPPIVIPQEEPFINEADSPYRKTMTGKIAVGIIIVSGPGNVAINNTEKNKGVSEVMGGLRVWQNAAPASANLQFQLYHYYTLITIPDSTSCRTYPACHDRFANAALKKLGYPTGRTGRDKLARNIKDKSNADGAYIGYISKYRQKHFAYASNLGPMYMQYQNDGWKPDRLDQIFAHETGHIFYAPDEYGGCKCNTKQHGKGSCTAKNGNCKNCPDETVKCVMKFSTFTACEYTKKHVGWC